MGERLNIADLTDVDKTLPKLDRYRRALKESLKQLEENEGPSMPQ
jgi:hypothetical protein